MYTEVLDQPSTQTKQMLVQIFHFLEKPPPPRVVVVVVAMTAAVAVVEAVAVVAAAAMIRMVYSGKCMAGSSWKLGNSTDL